ncbi:MAG TPA: ABC transporter ATP-binding protein [Azospirillum sp.]|nr:ABC transporter ATP-binding protein [Azospirillum sp.]
MFTPEPIRYTDLTPEGLPASPWRFLWAFVRRRFLGRVLLLNLTAAGGIGLMVMEPVALKALVDELSAGRGWEGGALFWFLALGGLWIGSALFNRAREVTDIITSPPLRFEIQSYLFSYLSEHSPRYFQENFAGSLGQKVKQAGQSALQLVDILTNDIIRIVIVLSVSLYLLAAAHSFFAVLLVGWTAVQLAISAALARRCMVLSKAFSEQVSASTGHMVDVISNIELVRAFVRREHEHGRLSEALGKEAMRSKALRWFLVKQWFILFNALLVFQITLIGIAVSEATAGRMSVGDFAMVFSLASVVGNNVWNLSTRMLGFFENLGNLSGALSVIVRPHEVVDRPHARPLVVEAGSIDVRGVRFAHGDGTPVFDNLALGIRPGEKVALVGPSGAGKSTLVKLLRRQYDPQAGRILIDGQDIAEVTLDSLNAAVAEVPQAPALFHRTIRDNIAYAAPDAAEAAVLAAARKAHCHEFILQRPQGYDAVVGEQGIRLSGGERQRIAIARAFLKDAPILVLDEATSALDSETEHLIQDALWELFKGRTVIAIAHRLSTITGMDRILYMERGRVLETGSHTELLARQGRYAELWRRQVGGFLPSEGMPGEKLDVA